MKARRGPECELCGWVRPLRLAPLRVAWEDRAVEVCVCGSCSGLVWRTFHELVAERDRAKSRKAA